MSKENEFIGVWGMGGNIGQAREGLIGLCVNAGFHRMSEAFELRMDTVLPFNRQTAIVVRRRKRSQGKGKKMCEEGIVTQGEKSIEIYSDLWMR